VTMKKHAYQFQERYAAIRQRAAIHGMGMGAIANDRPIDLYWYTGNPYLQFPCTLVHVGERLPTRTATLTLNLRIGLRRYRLRNHVCSKLTELLS